MKDRSDGGVLGHTIIRAYGALVPIGWGTDGDRLGWGTGFALSYGVARMVQISLGLAYHRTQVVPTAVWDELRQVTTSVELVSPANLVRPWFGFGLGYYEEERFGDSGGVDFTEQITRRSFGTLEKSLGFNWGGGVGLHLSESVGVQVGGTFHGAITDQGRGNRLQLLSLQAGLSYVIR